MKHIYIAGKFSGKNSWDIENNIRAAEDCGLKVAQLGGVPVIPHTMYRFFEGTLPYQQWIDITADLLRRCDAIVLLPSWVDSGGAKGEHEIAIGMGIPVFERSDPYYGMKIGDFIQRMP